MKRKALTLALVLVLLFSAVAGAQVSLLAKANPVEYLYPGTPNIDIESPTSRTYSENSLPLNVTIRTKNSHYEIAEGTSTVGLVSYRLDGENSQVLATKTSRGQPTNPANYTIGEYTTFATSAFLSDLREGEHKLTVRAEFDYTNPAYGREAYFHTEWEKSVYFRIDLVPQNISILMDRDSTYMLTVPLEFFVDEPASWMGYSLDGKENVTVTGNITLPAPSVGQHTLTLYAKDASGNPARSETITFSVADPLPILLVVAVSVAAIGVLVYFKKRNHARINNIVK